MNLLINIDVPDLDIAFAFYTEAFGLTVTRRFGANGAELDGWPALVSPAKVRRVGGSGGEMGVIRAEIGKKRRHLPIRRLLERAATAVQKVKPVFLMSPLSVAQFLPPGRIEFDLLVIDEASQVPPRLKVLWTAACMLRKRWAERADLKRCILRSRRRTA